MATVNGSLADTLVEEASYSPKGRFVTIAGYDSTLGGTDNKTNYKMQAVDPTQPSGYSSWINTSGDDTNKPVTATGTGVRVASWPG